ncbi:MAG TPA: glycosyltransferase, partial [Thermoanaerobaculaceae bacterium]|nr:glycosyltransferase [Thermoanaerobaculaceae bacterium]
MSGHEMEIARSTGDDPVLSIVVPVANGAGSIAQTISDLATYLHASGHVCEIVVVDDGSTDETVRLVERARVEAAVPVVLLRHDHNLGKGAAVRTGMLGARGRFRLFMDADMAYPPAEIGVILERLLGGADVAIASRVHPESRYVLRPSFFRYLYTRHLSGRFFNWLVRILLLPGISDTQAGLKGFTARAAVVLFSGWLPEGFGFDLAVLAKARQAGLEIVEVPVTFRYDREPTTMRFLADTVGMLRDLAMVRMRVGHGGAIAAGARSAGAAIESGTVAWAPPWRLLALLLLMLGGVEAARALH